MIFKSDYSFVRSLTTKEIWDMDVTLSLVQALSDGSLSLYGLYENMCVGIPGLSKLYKDLDDTLPLLDAYWNLLNQYDASTIDSFLKSYEQYQGKLDTSYPLTELVKDIEALKADGSNPTKEVLQPYIDKFLRPLKYMLYHFGLERKRFLMGEITEDEYKSNGIAFNFSTMF